jgi:hydroxymethylpyrimidine/phosphomethylpyrimidine kinase
MSALLDAKLAQLTEVRAAISAILTRGQSHMVMDGGAQRQLTRANLKYLEERERRLETEVARLEQAEATGGGIRVNHGYIE